MIRGYRWKRITGVDVLVRTADGRHMALIDVTLAGQYRWHVQPTRPIAGGMGFADSLKEAKLAAEKVVKG